MKILPIILTLLLASASAAFAQTAATPLKPGSHPDLPVTKRFFADAKTFYKESAARKMKNAFEKGTVNIMGWKDYNTGTPESWVEYGEGKLLVYIPDNYDGSAAFGVYLHISPSTGTGLPDGYAEILKAKKLVFVSPYNADNHKPYLQRVARAMDALATAKTLVKVDDKRIIVGGLSGGGHVAFMTQMVFPKEFKGAISHAAQSYIPNHFPGFDVSDCKQGERRKIKWAIVSGDKDFNYKEILSSNKDWEKLKVPFRFFDVKGMGHSTAPAKTFGEIIEWIEK